MKYEYDPESDGLYVWFVDIESSSNKYKSEVWPIELKNQIGLLFDEAGKLMGLEVQPASLYFDENKLSNMKHD